MGSYFGNNNSGGGGNNTMIIVILGLVVCCCLSSIGASAFVYFNDKANAWFKDTFGIGDEDEAPAPPPPPVTGCESTGCPATGDPPPPADAPPAANGPPPAANGPPPASGNTSCETTGTCANKTGTQWYCPYPWYSDKLMFDAKGMNPKCRSEKVYNGKGDNAIKLPGANTGKIHQQMKNAHIAGIKKYTPNGVQVDCPCLRNTRSTLINMNNGETWCIEKTGKLWACQGTELAGKNNVQ